MLMLKIEGAAMVGVALAVAAVPVAVRAQEQKIEQKTEQKTEQTRSTATAGQLQTVTVSAERRAENVRNVPVSATIIGEETLNALLSLIHI